MSNISKDQLTRNKRLVFIAGPLQMVAINPGGDESLNNEVRGSEGRNLLLRGWGTKKSLNQVPQKNQKINGNTEKQQQCQPTIPNETRRQTTMQFSTV